MAHHRSGEPDFLFSDLPCEQGAPGRELFLLLDGVLEVVCNGTQLAEVGPGAVLGERALLERGLRTATLRAVTPCKVAIASEDKVDRARLEALATQHRRELAAEGKAAEGKAADPKAEP